MTQQRLRGVIAAIATACDDRYDIDLSRSLKLARFLLENGCDGLNVLGTTGEATSFSLSQRQRLMSAYKSDGMPLNRLMVGTGAASVSDAISLTQHAADLGFAGALVLPPFYYKGVPDEGLEAYIAAIVGATSDRPIPIYLYHFPGMSAVPWKLELIQKLRASHGARIAGLKDSSGDMPYARAATGIEDFDVFPSNEAVLIEARNGAFAGCISATAQLSPDLCGRAWQTGDQDALDKAVTIRKLFDGKPLVSGIKSLLAHIHGDPAWAQPMPPLGLYPAHDRTLAAAGHDAVRSAKVA
ncbi:4-hydroxy-tetrahydrodipicolinate synthase [Variibacter gotjawalensis]|uniref:4-hydroxy-tetrahydrodipicolinate synthase n=1 Tax=Variibacter gotjawalensis TaxID=1333996 RepID=A0A0S3PPD3_9BRAD|nr:dihydrodipicolinate synthase family protein [Variibacter gotjawalensis]NIK48026.1 4-hydroxy-tetrahydrodipicolinate synthase [Variibacter gotjawalensis]RZS49903.1 4-hydroxy-tetrahydrodipicolinate synthase [Variibacter gotjawalensis]BAT57731.1 4-hydroxy-tetrahydrodipicolinate synthase [Variibacter gotjawalensis]